MKPGKDFIGVGVGIILIRDNKILLLLRKDRNEWSIPGGKVELNEKIEDTALREMKEEIGVDIKILKMLDTVETFADNVHWLSIIVVGKIIKGEPKNMEEEVHSEIKWFDLNNLPEKQFLPSKLAIEAYLKENCMKNKFQELVDASIACFEKDPWKKEQSLEQLKDFLIGEAKEVAEVIEKKEYNKLADELGDLLYLAVSVIILAEREGLIKSDDVFDEITAKLRRRCPHVFGNMKIETAEEALKVWNEIKKKEKEGFYDKSSNI